MKGIIAVWFYGAKTQRMVERPGCCHGFKGVETHPFIATGACLVNDSLCQCQPDFSVAMAGNNIEPFHFTYPVFQGTQGRAPNKLIIALSQKNAAIRRRIFSGQYRQLSAESLEFEINPQLLHILFK